MKRWSIAALAAGIAIAVACSPDDFVEYQLPGVDDGASGGVQKAARFDGTADLRIELKTGATLTVPQKALDQTLVISMERPSDKAALDLIKTAKSLSALASAPYVLTPHGTKFKEPVSVELPITKDTDKRLVVAWLEDEDDREWKKLGTPVVKNGKATLQLDHFSVVMLMEEGKSGFSADDASDAGATQDGGSIARGDAGSASGGNEAGAALDAGTAPLPDANETDAAGDIGGGNADASSTTPEAGIPISPDAGSTGSGGSDDAGPARDASAPLDAGAATADAGTGSSEAGAGLPDGGLQSETGPVMLGDGGVN